MVTNDELESTILEAITDLEAIIEYQFNQVKRHPGLQRQYERDMDIVIRSKAALALLKSRIA